MASDFKDLVRQQQWYKDEIAAAGEARAMELLSGLLDAGVEEALDSDTRAVEAVVISESAVPATVQRRKRIIWHLVDGDYSRIQAVGPRGERLEVTRSSKRTAQLYWWSAKVNGQQVERCLKQSDAKKVCVYAVTAKVDR